MKNNRNIIKIIIIGDTNVGKTCLVRQYLQEDFSSETENTIGLEYATRDINIDSDVVNARIWDTAGQERFQSLVETYFHGTDGALIVYDICSRESFNNVQKWIDKLHKKCEEPPAIILIGNKLDLESKRKVTIDEAVFFSQKEEIDYFETSAKTGENVQDVFYRIERQAYQKLKLKRMKIDDEAEITNNEKQANKCSC